MLYLVQDNLCVYVWVCVCVRVCGKELSTITSCPAVPAVAAYKQTSVFPHLRHAALAFALHILQVHTHSHILGS